MPPPPQNYGLSKATFGTASGLEQSIVQALLRQAGADTDGNRFLWSVTRAVTGQADLPGVSANTDILSVNFSSAGSLDLRPSATNALPAGQLAKLDVVAFSSHTDVTLNLGAFRGVALLGDGDDTITSTGRVVMRTGGGEDTVTLGNASDTLLTGQGDDVVHAGAGDNVVVLDGGNDSLVSAGGQDYVSAGAGADTVSTGAGNDTVYTGGGNDSVSTGAGDDLVVINRADSGDSVVVRGGAGSSDTLDLSLVAIDTTAPDGGADQVGGTGPVTVSLVGGATVTIYGVETFIYDTDGAGPDGAVEVGLAQFLATF